MNRSLGLARRFYSTLSPTAYKSLETRWTKLPECEQGAIADSLAVAEKGDWKKLSLDQKRATYGPYGARLPSDPSILYRVAGWVSVIFAAAVVVWKWWESAKPKIRTQTPEWKEAERLLSIENKQNPYTGAYAKELAKTN